MRDDYLHCFLSISPVVTTAILSSCLSLHNHVPFSGKAPMDSEVGPGEIDQSIATQVYKGSDEILLSKLILDPTHSILKQSFDSRLRLVRSSPSSSPSALHAVNPSRNADIWSRTLDEAKTTQMALESASTPTLS
jgi:hypothetical protein